METSNLQLEILQRIYHKQSIWELESIDGFTQALKYLFERHYIYPLERKYPPTSYDPYAHIKLTAKGSALAMGYVV